MDVEFSQMDDHGGQAADSCDKVLWDLAGELGNSWRRIGRCLGCKEPLLENLEADYHGNAHERAYQMLRGWKNRTNHSGPMEEQLRLAFKDTERQDLMRFVTNFSGRCPPIKELNKSTLIKKLKAFVNRNMSRLPLIPWISTGCVHVNQVFTNVQLLINIATAYLPVRLPLKSHNAIFMDLTEEGEGFTDSSSTRILMRGRTGSGKTTLLTKYAYDWCVGKQGALLQYVPVVFILPMRKIDQSSNLGQAVLDHMLPTETQITADAIEQLCLDHSDEVVILLDGYDEFKGKGLDHECCGNIVKILRGECFPECRVVVTTRPSRVSDFQNEYESYRHLEITGFTSKDIDDYVHKVFKGEHRPLGDKLLVYLEENQLKDELASIPLMLTAFCQLAKWTDGKDFGELNTVSKLFDRLIECVFKHDHSKTAKKKTPSDATASHSSTSFLTSDELIFELGKVALDGLLGSATEELIFSKDDFSRCSDDWVQVIEQGVRVGLLCSDEDSSIRPKSYEDLRLKRQKLAAPKKNISFILKSLQEKCAGNYLAHLLEGDEGDVESFKTYLQKVNSDQRVLDWVNILVFASAASTKAARQILSHVIFMLRDRHGENISQYLNGKLHFQDCPKTQRLIETCLQLNFESNGEGCFNDLFNDLFGESCCLRLVGISSYVAKALGHLFVHSCQRSPGQELSSASVATEGKSVLSVRSLQLICIKLDSSTQFREFLNCYPGAEEKISSFMGDSVETKTQSKFPKLREKFVSSEQQIPSYLGDRPDLTFFAVVPIWQEVSKRQVHDFSLGFVLSGLKECLLQELVLNGVNAECKDWEELFEMINRGVFVEMTKLTLSLNDLKFNQTARLAASLMSTPKLKFLKMAGNEVGEGFVERLPRLQHLDNVILDKSNMSSKAIVAFTKKLELYPGLTKLDLRRNKDTNDDAIYSICDHLSDRQTSWKELRLSLYNVSEAGLEYFTSRIGQAAGLTHLNLVHTPIPDNVIYNCALALPSLLHLVDLRISGIPSSSSQKEGVLCTPQTVDTFARELRKLQHLAFLSFLYTEMMPDDFLKMLDGCRKHTSLKTFRFSRTFLPSGEDVQTACKEAEKTFLQLWV